MAGLVIEKVVPGSIADEMELEAGDRLLTINGHAVRDIIDYNYFTADEQLLLEVAKGDGEIWEVEIERDEEEGLGIMFPAPRPLRCGNNCIFCFVHQLPPGMRRPLYVKDEDYRLSFLYGNYVTLANICPGDLQRIKEQRLSPLYISVHATEPVLRERLLGKEGIIPILDILRELATAGIAMHCQVVLCPGFNDGAVLEKTVDDLASLHPQVQSLAIVPVGLTRHRDNLPVLTPVSAEYARDFVRVWQERARTLAKKLGEPFLFLADEFFIKGGEPFPPLDEYGDLPQLENGVGLVPLFLAEAAEVLAAAEALNPLSVTVVTGMSPYPFLADFLQKLSERTGTTLKATPIPNRLFGESVTVTGLVAGADIVHELLKCETGEVVIIPDVMLKEGEGVFLDDMTVSDLESALQKRIAVAESTPWGFYEVLLKIAGFIDGSCGL